MRRRFLGYLSKVLRLWFYYRSVRELSAGHNGVIRRVVLRPHRSEVRLLFFGNAETKRAARGIQEHEESYGQGTHRLKAILNL